MLIIGLKMKNNLKEDHQLLQGGEVIKEEIEKKLISY